MDTGELKASLYGLFKNQEIIMQGLDVLLTFQQDQVRKGIDAVLEIEDPDPERDEWIRHSRKVYSYLEELSDGYSSALKATETLAGQLRKDIDYIYRLDGDEGES